MSSTKICVAGCGNWGKNLVRTFSSLGCLYGLYDPDVDCARALSSKYPAAKLFSDWQSVLDDPQITAVAVASPAEYHFELTMAALQAGKHVFVEKPLALEWEDGAEMVETARKRRPNSDGGASVALSSRRNPSEGSSSTKACSGASSTSTQTGLSMGKIRREENALWSFAPHDISVILALVGQMPVQVTATGGAYLQPNIADVTVSNLLFDRGTRAHIFVSWLHPYKEQRLVVIGSKQMAVFEDTLPDRKLMLFNRQIELKNGALEAIKPEGVVVDFQAGEPLLLECQHFLECVDQDREPRTPGEEGVRVLQVLQACQRSLQLSGEPVQVRQLRQKVMAL